MTMLPKLIYRFSAILIRIPNNIFAEIDNLILNIKNFQIFKLDLEKAEEQRSNCQHPLDHRQSKRVPEKHLFCFIDYTKAFDFVDYNKLWESLQEMGMPDHFIYLLKNLYTGQEATVRTRHGKMDWFQIGKGVRQGCILSHCLFNFYAEYIMRNAGLDVAQAGINIARSISNLRYADDTTLMAESEEELKSLLMKVKEESENVGLKFSIQI